MAGFSGCFKIVCQNNIIKAKGLGFSASGFVALGAATSTSLDLKIDYIALSEIVRLGAGSTTRSLAESFALWYANKNERSYAEQLTDPETLEFAIGYTTN